MKVYIVVYGYDYEGHSVPVRVFSDKDVAVNWAQNNKSGDWTSVIEYEVDSDKEPVHIN